MNLKNIQEISEGLITLERFHQLLSEGKSILLRGRLKSQKTTIGSVIA